MPRAGVLHCRLSSTARGVPSQASLARVLLPAVVRAQSQLGRAVSSAEVFAQLAPSELAELPLRVACAASLARLLRELLDYRCDGLRLAAANRTGGVAHWRVVSTAEAKP
jgi:hypothetical protein